MSYKGLLICGLLVQAALFPWAAHASTIVIFQDRVSFANAIDGDRSLVKIVEAWDTYPAGTIFPDGATVNGITYSVSRGDALVVGTGISLSPPHNLYQTAGTDFRPLIDTFTFSFVQPVLAFGITFSSTFANRNGDYLLTTDRGDVIPSFFDPVYPGFSLGQFAGFRSDEAFRTVTVSSTANALYGMDDLIVAVPVPEASSLALLGFGFCVPGILAALVRLSRPHVRRWS